MQSTFSFILPFLIFTIIVSGLVFPLASIILVFDLRKMQQERTKELPSVWYQRPRVRNSLKMIGFSVGLSLYIGAFGQSLVDHAPIWKWIYCILAASYLVIEPGVALIRDLRYQKRLPSVWHQHPRILKQSGNIAWGLGTLLLIGSPDIQTQIPQDSPFLWSWSIIFAIFLLLLLAAALHVYAYILQKPGTHF